MSRVLLLVAFSALAVYAGPLHSRSLFGHPSPPPCGLPPFIDDLPEDAQEKLKEIWKNWKEGEKCYHEQGLTRELMDSLPKDIRRKIHKDAFLPPVVRKAPADVQDQFRKLINDKSISLEDKPKKIHELAQKVLTGDLLKEFNEFYKKIEEKNKELDEKADKLSPEAKEAYDKISKLEKEKHEIMSSLSESAQEELFEIYKARYGKRPKKL
ncbi:DUF148 domain-containing protein [Trichostrongylus colubriformis]|uniref:DUF148 domain-containing protein n=1 Tax=Trichostrongylus colubriformis TaxID=6319 RepID=A0AAN8IQC0_TRICO